MKQKVTRKNMPAGLNQEMEPINDLCCGNNRSFWVAID